jgi:hypothetical protein
VDEEGVSLRAIAEAHARGLKVPVVRLEYAEVEAHFGWLAPFVALDLPSSGELTQRTLHWTPTGPGLLSDLKDMDYTQA